MKDHDYKIKQKQHQYDLLKPVNMSNLAPRQGYYLIMNVSRQALAGVDCTIARCLWKQHKSDHFDLDFHVTVQLKSLEGEHSVGPKHKLTGSLLKSIIHVTSAKVLTINNDRVFAVEWSVLNDTTPNSTGSIDDERELNLAAAIANCNEEDIDLISAINTQLDLNDDVMQAILRFEDNMYDEYELTNEMIFALQAQNLPVNK